MSPPAALDLQPQPPLQPNFGDCCGNGCEPCILDLHDLAMDQYRQAMRAWRERHSEAQPAEVDRPSGLFTLRAKTATLALSDSQR